MAEKQKVYIIESRWIKLTDLGLKLLIVFIALIGVITMMIINVGYDNQQGCYWKPADVKVDIKRKEKAPE